LRKFLFFGLVILLISQSLMANTMQAGECEAAYRSRSADEYIKRNKVSDIAGTLYVVGSIGGVASGFLPLTAISTVFGLPLAMWHYTDGKATKTIDLLDEDSKRMNKLLKKARKKISAQIMPDDISDVLIEGLDSGLFCSTLPKFWSHTQIRKHIMKELEKKF
jgi:hypothetical protein